MEFKDKCCLVTGGARGIGKAIVISLLQNGAKVLIGDVNIKVKCSIFSIMYYIEVN